MTILDACVRVLVESAEPLSSEEIYRRIREKQLFEFKARDPAGIVRAALRKHLRKEGAYRVVLVGGGKFKAT